MRRTSDINSIALSNFSSLKKAALEEFIQDISQKFHDRLSSVILYGSYARGDALPDSDVDVLVVLNSSEDLNRDWDECIDIVADIASRTGVLISVLVCLAKDYAERQHPLLINVRREGVKLI